MPFALLCACSSSAARTTDTHWLDGVTDGVVCEGPASENGPAGRDWSRCPAIVQVDSDADIYALGDVHGDYQRLTALLSAGGISSLGAGPDHATWQAGSSVLVCSGDLIDKGADGLKVIALLASLTISAKASGGKVIVTMGNHEAEFLADPKSSNVKEFYDELKNAGISGKSVAVGGESPGPYLRALPFAARVNDWFFSHAGNTGGRMLDPLNSDLTTGVDASGFGAAVLADADSLLEAHLQPNPWWEGQAQAPEQVLAQYAAAVGVRHFVQGHQPDEVTFADGTTRPRGSMFQKFGLIFLIDVGMSAAIDDSKGALLRIHRADSGTAIASVINHKGVETMLWQEGP